jgi:hypothetical protein
LCHLATDHGLLLEVMQKEKDVDLSHVSRVFKRLIPTSDFGVRFAVCAEPIIKKDKAVFGTNANIRYVSNFHYKLFM